MLPPTWRCFALQKELVNEAIKAPEVRVIDENGQQVGILKTSEALRRAADANLDLVCVAPNASPPVCRIMDFGKYKYEESKKRHRAKQKQHVTHVKGIRLRIRTEDHDLQYRIERARKFLAQNDKVEVVVFMRGREAAHADLARDMLKRFVDALGDCAKVERPISREGSRVYVLLSPASSSSKSKPKPKPKQAEGKKAEPKKEEKPAPSEKKETEEPKAE